VYPENLRYNASHQWVRVEDGIAVIGITHYAQNQLGDLVYAELPEVGRELAAEEAFGSVESVKAVSDIFAPIAGKVTEVNEALRDEPERINKDCYGDGWIIKVQMSDPSQVNGLLDAAAYQQTLS
jgi:glycine cleavage system H protein